MLHFLKSCSASHHIFLPVFKIFPIVRRESKLFLLRFSSSNKYRNFEHDKKKDPQNQDKVILYQNNNSQYFKKMKLFSLFNYIIWTLFGVSIYDSLSKEPKLNDELKEKWIESDERRQLTKRLIVGSIILGFFLVLAIWFYFLRSIKQIQVIKSARLVEFQTYSFFPSVREFSVPLKDVSGIISRHAAKGHIPIKIRNTLFYFLIDVKGHFPNPFLFDNSIGVKRDFKSSLYD